MSAGELCQRCGLCCDGTLFTLVPLGPTEPTPRPLRIVDRPDGSRALRQPCAALVDGACQVYEARPSVCRSFECAILVALGDKEITLEEAVAEVDAARALLARGPRERAMVVIARRFGHKPRQR